MNHWDEVYATRDLDTLSWHQAEPSTSLRLLRAFARPPASVLDVGAGASQLADYLLALGWADITLLDVSGTALASAEERLVDKVSYVTEDVLAWTPQRTYSAWHDRAVFHFLTDPSEQDRYVGLASAAVSPGGVVLLGCFAPDGPPTCSGLATARWSARQLRTAFGGQFSLIHHEREEHVTPNGDVQPFTWVVLRRH